MNILCYLNLEEEVALGSDSSIKNDDNDTNGKEENKKKKYQKKSEEKTSKNDVRHFIII